MDAMHDSGRIGMRRKWRLLAGGALMLGVMVASPTIAAAKSDHSHGAQTCSGTFASPGVLSGTYSGNVLVTGVCLVNAGPAVINGNLSIEGSGAAVAAVFALNDHTGTGTSSLTVNGNVEVRDGATFFLGCIPRSFACLDDPNQNSPTLSSAGVITGNLDEH